MKKFLLLATLMVATMSANAQFEKGSFSIQPKIGIGSGFITNMPDLREDLSQLGLVGVGTIDLTRSVFPSITAGVEAEYMATDMLGVSAALTYTLEGGAWRTFRSPNLFLQSPNIALGYISLPLMANVYVYEGLAVKAGVELGFLAHANERMTIEYTPQSALGEAQPTVFNEKYKESILKECNRFRCAIPIGLSYTFDEHMTFDLRYHIDLTRINKEKEETGDLRNSTILLTIGYRLNFDD